MKTLCMDTAHKNLIVALYENDRMICGIARKAWKRQSEDLFPAIIECMEKAGWDSTDLDEVVITDGPGSYTGVRIAMTVAKVLCTRQGVTVMRVCNVKHVTLVKEKSTRNARKSPIRGATPSKYAPRCVSRAFFVTRWSLRGGTSGRADRGASCRDARPYRKDATPWR